MPHRPLKVALAGLGLEAYWPQFEGLRTHLENYLSRVSSQLTRPNVEVLDLGLVDTIASSREAGRRCRREDADILFLYITTYAVSSTVLSLIQRAAIPVIVLNLQPTAAIDYAAFAKLPNRTAMTGHWLEYCSACPVPEIANLFARTGIPLHQVTGYLGEPHVDAELNSWLSAATAASALREATIGLMGHYYSGMLDIYTDVTRLSATFGSHIEILEVDQLSALRETVDDTAIEARVAEFHLQFDVQPDCSPDELTRAARTSVALDRLAAAHDLQALAYYYMGSGNPANEDTMSSVILGNSLLTARHIPVAGEYEVKNVVAMKILDLLGAGGSFTEYYAVDFDADHVLMGHDGPGHTGIAEGRTKVRPLTVYHGKVGRGLSVEMSVKHGPVTLLSVVEDTQHGFKLLVAEGSSEPGPILEIGNTNSRYKFPLGARGFLESWNSHGPAHHCAIGLGHRSTDLKKLAALLGIPCMQVC
jgi:L-arabinose isomerase